MKPIQKLIPYDVDDVLELIGLERRRSFFSSAVPALAFMAAGAAIGAGIGLMFAPSSGRRLRQEVGDRFGQLRDRVKEEAEKQGVMNAAPAQG